MTQKRNVLIDDIAILAERPDNDVMYDFVQAYNMDMSTPKDYGTGIFLYSIEAHMLQFIGRHPGTTITYIANNWKRNKATISPQIAKLEQRGLVRKEKDLQNNRVIHLYLTESGKKVNLAHEQFDAAETKYAVKCLREKYSDGEILGFFNILEDMGRLIQKRMVEPYR